MRRALEQAVKARFASATAARTQSVGHSEAQDLFQYQVRASFIGNDGLLCAQHIVTVLCIIRSTDTFITAAQDLPDVAKPMQ
jgi:hypothetical protein